MQPVDAADFCCSRGNAGMHMIQLITGALIGSEGLGKSVCGAQDKLTRTARMLLFSTKSGLV